MITAGIAYREFKLEASGFHGAEPGENRWITQQGAINSWSARLWYFPTKHCAAQVSVGRLTKPEALEAGDQFRTTASVEYSTPMPGQLVVQFDLGQGSQHRHRAQLEFLSRGIRTAHSGQELHHRTN